MKSFIPRHHSFGMFFSKIFAFFKLCTRRTTFSLFERAAVGKSWFSCVNTTWHSRFLLFGFFLTLSIIAQASDESTIGGKTGAGHIIQDEGSTLRQRVYLNFTGSGVTCSDSGGKTVCNVTSSGSSSGAPTNASYVTATPDSTLSNEQALSSLTTGILKNTTGTGVLSIATSGTDYAPATSGSAILKGNGSGGFSSAASGTDYAPATSGSAILKGNGSGGFSNAADGTDYVSPTTNLWQRGGTNVSLTTTTDFVGIGTTTPKSAFNVFSGNVGIGTLTPSAAFSVGSGGTFITSGNTTTISSTNSSTVPVTLTANALANVGALTVSSSSSNATIPTALVSITNSGTSGSGAGLSVDARGSGYVFRALDQSADTTPFLIDQNGNVGIGTVNPQAQMDLRFQTPTVPFMIGNSATDQTGAYLKIDSAGNVGIATVSPMNKLQVNGTFQVDNTNSIGWSVVNATNQACNTTCISACVDGHDLAGGGKVGCADATADQCLCAGPN